MLGLELYVNIDNFVKLLYPYSPIYVQNILCSLYGYREMPYRFGKKFEQWLDFLEISEKWSKGEIEAYQDAKVAELIKYVFENVPYYRATMKKLQLVPNDIKKRADLVKMPIITKEDIFKNMKQFISQSCDNNILLHQHTSGTTGKALQFFSTKEANQFKWAIWWRHRMRFGVNFGEKHANFTGKLVVPTKQTKPPYWRWNKPFNQAIINMQHINIKKIKEIVNFLNENDFLFYSGYPSIIHSFAMCCLEDEVSLFRKPSFIFTGAENIYEYQKKDIKLLTSATISDQYGSSEGAGNASHCNKFKYHEDFEFGVLECIDGTRYNDGTKEGKIICTGFACKEFPFIRYDIGDYALWESDEYLCDCGRKSSVIRWISGREDEYILTPEGNRIMRFDYIFKDTNNIKECQVVQDKLGEIIIRAVVRPSYNVKTEKLIANEIHNWISPNMAVTFKYVNAIERNKNGKYKAVISNLK